MTTDKQAPGYWISIPFSEFKEGQVIASRGGNGSHAWDEQFVWYDGWSLEKIGGVKNLPTSAHAYPIPPELTVCKMLEAFSDGSVHEVWYANLSDSFDWGAIAVERRRDLHANRSGSWEAAIEGKDEYNGTVAQTWYASMRDAIAENLLDLDNPPAELIFRFNEWEIEEKGGFEKVYFEFFKVAGYSSPCGSPFYRPTKNEKQLSLPSGGYKVDGY